MIVAEIYTQADGKIAAFVFRGHSETNTHGYDVHCAEVSMLSQSAYLGIRQYLNRDAALENHEHGGLGVELKNAPDDLTEAIFQTMLIGLRSVEKVAPQVVKVQMIQIDKSSEENLQNKIKQMTPSRSNPLPKLNVSNVKIRAKIYMNDAGYITGFAVEERNTKIVKELKIYCASIWILVKSTFSCVKDHLKRDLKFDSKSRRLVMKLKTPPDEITEAVFQTMLIGLREVEKLAPQVINVTENFSTEVKSQ